MVKYLLDGDDIYIHVLEDGSLRYHWDDDGAHWCMSNFCEVKEGMQPRFAALLAEHGVKIGPSMEFDAEPYVSDSLVPDDDAVPMPYMYEQRKAERLAYNFSPLGEYHEWFRSRGRAMRKEMQDRRAAGLDKGFYAAANWQSWSSIPKVA